MQSENREETRVSNESRRKLQRMLIGGFAISLGLIGVIAHWMPGIEAGSARFIAGTSWKVGVVLAIAWLASPQLERLGWDRIRGTMLAAVSIVIVLYAIRPRIGAIAGLILVGGSAAVAMIGWVRQVVRRTG